MAAASDEPLRRRIAARVRADLADVPWLVLWTPAVWAPGILIVGSAIWFGLSGGGLSGGSYLAFQVLVFPPSFAPFVSGLLAPRASYLAGAITGLLAAVVFAVYVLVGPIERGQLSGEEQASYIVYALVVSPIAGIIIGALGGGLRLLVLWVLGVWLKPRR